MPTKTHAKRSHPSRTKPTRTAKPARKGRARPTTAKTPTYPFPYIGSGDASYYEYVKLLVILDRAISPAMLESATALLPRALRESSIFGAKNNRRCVVLWMGDEGQSTFLRTVADGINRGIERWLNALHKVHPIACAFRPHDPESKGTRYDDWHRWSLNNVPVLGGLWKRKSPFDNARTLSEGLTEIKRQTTKQASKNAKAPKTVKRRAAKTTAVAKRKPRPAARSSDRSLKNGDYVVIMKGQYRANEGTVFWIGKSKFGDGRRFGIRSEDAQIYWADEDAVKRTRP